MTKDSELPCSREDHEAMKADPARWVAETDAADPERLKVGGVTLWSRNCKRCGSTLTVPLARLVRS